jgi:glyoxylase-like metal-dependent hydrolase (beta-lactamase superfamily II)
MHNPLFGRWLTLRLIAVACLLAWGTATAHAAGAHVSSARLYVLDCGTIVPMDPTLFGLKPEDIHGDGGFVTPCFLIVHPKGTLMWDVGQIPDQDIPDDGTEVLEQKFLKAKRRLVPQLEDLGFHPKDITYVAMSHYHIDHTANANLFAASTWIVQQAEYEAMFASADTAIRAPQTYSELKNANRIILDSQDHDVFGDGTVIIKTAPGHTPGHQILFLKLRQTGPLLLEGDLYHFPEEKTLDRVPGFDFNADMTRATRRKVAEFVKRTGAKEWIQHDPQAYAAARKPPEFYD